MAIGSFLLPPSPRLFGAFDLELGGSRYEGFANFSRLLTRVRLGWLRAGPGTAWVNATWGVSASASSEALLQGAAGFRVARRDVSFALSATGTAIGNLQYADLEATISHGRAGELQAEASVGGRANDPEGDVGPFVEAVLTIPLASGAALVLAGGRFATDLVRGSVAGRYVTAAFRLSSPFRRRRPLLPPPRENSLAGGAATVAAALADVRCDRRRACTIAIRAADASRVEVMGDFTDWAPTSLQRAEPGVWRMTALIAAGRHRLNVRVDGGPWGIPAGVTAVADDFQGLVGTIVVP